MSGRSAAALRLYSWGYEMRYKQGRNYENLQKTIYPGVGKYDIPAIAREMPEADNWIGFNFAIGCAHPEKHTVHFFVDDYQFVRLWTYPDNYLDMLRRFEAVCSPDFSTFTDFPLAMQIYNHYRKHWMAAYWQDNGIHVIPTISWSDEKSYAWCFDGEPEGGCVAVSSTGAQRSRRERELFLSGYNAMLERLHPEVIYFYGNVPEECGGNIRHIEPFSTGLKQRVSKTERRIQNML